MATYAEALTALGKVEGGDDLLKAVKEYTKAIIDERKETQTRLTSAQTLLDALDATDGSLDERVNTAKTTIADLKAKLLKAETSQADLQSKLTASQASLDTIQAKDKARTRLDNAQSVAKGIGANAEAFKAALGLLPSEAEFISEGQGDEAKYTIKIGETSHDAAEYLKSNAVIAPLLPAIFASNAAEANSDNAGAGAAKGKSLAAPKPDSSAGKNINLADNFLQRQLKRTPKTAP